MSNPPSKGFNSKETEEKWTRLWFDKGLFNLKIDKDKPSFSVALPPPNITGNLHMGHALNGTIQDVLSRYMRMTGHNVLWQPGTDHAGISTQMVVERKLKKEGKTRHQMGREKFLESCWQWREQYGNAIYNQYKKLGVSFSWDRQCFTMDPAYVKAIYRAFNILFKEGFIYRGKRVTNWCPRCQTSLSDLEVEHEDTKSSIYHIKYLLQDPKEKGTWLTVATTRPETIFGDVAVAVHPEDKRYSKFIGSSVLIPLTGRAIPIISDQYVDMEFGTGALKITPAHDVNDWEIGQRHKLEQPVVIDQTAKLVASDLVPSAYHGQERFEARKSVLADLEAGGLLAEVKDYEHGLGYCERCHTVIEPYLSDQWYVAMKELAQPAIKVVEDAKVNFVPSRYASTYLDWMGNIRDWCISRQLWWGHRIPVWTCQGCQKVDSYESTPDSCTACGGKSLEQDPDVLDTWFSSALWPFATLGWPDETIEMETFYPTTILSTAREIINLWVARMIFTSLKFVGKIPFRDVLIHPVIQTADGKRMSKSKGNAIDPLDMIERYGADANRFWFASLGIKGDQDVRFREDRLDEYKRFATKLWNAGSFVLLQLKGENDLSEPKVENLTLADKWILSKYNETLSSVERHLKNYDFDDASKALYDFSWDYFCDWYIESAKLQITENTGSETKKVLYHIYEGLMRALHPFMPFISEELWQSMPRQDRFAGLSSVMLSQYPKAEQKFAFADAEARMELIMRVTSRIRNLRHIYNVPAAAIADLILVVDDKDERDLFHRNISYINGLARVKASVQGEAPKTSGINASDSVASCKIILPLDSLIDLEKTREKLSERRSSAEKKLQEKLKLFQNEDFRARAPQDKVTQLQAEITDLETQLASVNSQLDVLMQKING